MELNCPACGVPPLDADGFVKQGTFEFDDLVYTVYVCWSCYVGFAVAEGLTSNNDNNRTE